MPFSPFDADRPEQMRRRLRQIPVRTLLPNLITLLALCAGLTAMRLAFDGKPHSGEAGAERQQRDEIG